MKTRPSGFCVDTGAPRSVIGLKSLKRILCKQGVRFPKLELSRNRFRFADSIFESLGKICIPLRTPPGVTPVPVVMDVVQADIPPLLGIDILDKESLIADTVSNRLQKRTFFNGQKGEKEYMDAWSVPLCRAESGHVYADMDWSNSVFFSRAQLAKLHRQFFHPSATKIFNLLRRARP